MRERGSKGGEGDRQTDSKNAGGKRVRERGELREGTIKYNFMTHKTF